jgi:hypothetical protein
MFRQRKKQNFIHNLRLATLLSFVAGIVLLESGCKTLTIIRVILPSSEEVIKQNYTAALHLFFTIYLGAFTSNFSRMDIKRPNSSHVIQFH